MVKAIARRAMIERAAVLTAATVALPRLARAGDGVDFAFESGLWFDGNRFVPRDITYVSGTTFVAQPLEGHTIARVDLGGKFVVPAYGDAHTHMFDASVNDDDALAFFLRAGIYYAQNMNDVAKLGASLRARVDHDDSVDVTFAHAGFTSRGGHPTALARALYVEHLRALRAPELDGNAYWEVDSVEDLARAWPRALGTGPDFVKLYLLNSDVSSKAANGARPLRTGLAPALVAPLVARAHSAGLRVHAHVETANDVRVALAGGVDRIAHLPGTYFASPDRVAFYRITDTDAARAAAAGTTFTATTNASARLGAPTPYATRTLDERTLAAIVRTQIENVATLRRHAVPIALGSDVYFTSSVDEARRLVEIGAMTRVEAVRALCIVTPQAIFPNRKLGGFSPGCEANFLVLDGDPTSDLAHVTSISSRFKAGRPLIVSDAHAAVGFTRGAASRTSGRYACCGYDEGA